MKKVKTVSLSEEAINIATKKAKEQTRSFSAYVELLILKNK